MPEEEIDRQGDSIIMNGIWDRRSWLGHVTLISILWGLHGSVDAGERLANIGVYPKWSKIELTMHGPYSAAKGDLNPFSIFLDIVFTDPNGRTYKVPGFYDGDGKGGIDGNVWKARFSADQTGRWTFVSRSENIYLDGYTGSFSVTAPSDHAPSFYRWGRLEYTGTGKNKIRYLKFRDGSYWLKAGSDDPENFLGNFRNYDSLEKRKAAVDYLSGMGVNSMYILTNNIGGDENDVWPWLGSTPAEARDHAGPDSRFDIGKLDEWRIIFEYMQTKGVVPYLVLEDDSAWTGYDHGRYYRELIARFGYLPALIFNFCEEYNERYTISDALEYLKKLKEMDSFNHPLGIHNINIPNDAYIDAIQVDFTSIQTHYSDPLAHNKLSMDWIERSKERKKRIPVIGFDEPRPLMDRRGWWSAYMGGGTWEVHVDKPYDRPMSAWKNVWHCLGGARAFMESIPFWEMSPSNHLVKSGKAFCLCKPGEVYALYLPSGGTVTLEMTEDRRYEFDWWNPANGRNGDFQKGGHINGGIRSFSSPGNGDWVLRIIRNME